MKEAKEISGKVTCIPVKDKRNRWEPSYSETFPMIRENVIKAIMDIEEKEKIETDEPFIFKMELCDNFNLKEWKGYHGKGHFLKRKHIGKRLRLR
ncbi:hypothetical protein Holit_03328 [Hollandina sp. SP2]